MSTLRVLQRKLPLPPSPFTLVPNIISNKLILAILNQVFKAAISAGELDFLENKWVLIKVTDADLSWAMSLKNKTLIGATPQHKYDLCISAKACYFLSMAAKQKDPDTLFFQRKIQIQGSTELGLFVKNFLDSFEAESYWLSLKTKQVLQKSYPLLEKIICHNVEH